MNPLVWEQVEGREEAEWDAAHEYDPSAAEKRMIDVLDHLWIAGPTSAADLAMICRCSRPQARQALLDAASVGSAWMVGTERSYGAGRPAKLWDLT